VKTYRATFGPPFEGVTYMIQAADMEAAKRGAQIELRVMVVRSGGRSPDHVSPITVVEIVDTPTANELARWLVEWCSEHGQVESAFLMSNPAHYVFTFELLDDLAKKLGIGKDVIGQWFNAAQEARASKVPHKEKT
jgi:hypothetical protein